jgi:anti-anti-sigma factor
VVSVTVAFPDFSANRGHRLAHSFVCTLQVSEVGPAWVHVAGDLDISSAPRLDQALRHTDMPPRMVVLDLRGLISIDPSGVDVIVYASIRARCRNRRLMIIRGPSRVDRMFALSGASDVLKIVDLDPSEATAQVLPRLAQTDDAT